MPIKLRGPVSMSQRDEEEWLCVHCEDTSTYGVVGVSHGVVLMRQYCDKCFNKLKKGEEV